MSQRPFWRIDLSKRSDRLELIDLPGRLSRSEWEQVLRELGIINRWLGGESSLLRLLKPLVGNLARSRSGPVTLIDLGTGGGDIPAALASWARRKGYPLRILAIDSNRSACRIAYEKVAGFPEITVLEGDLFHPPLKPRGCDIICCSAVLHHFSNRQISTLLAGWIGTACQGVLITDLRRSLAAYLGILVLTRLFSRSPAVRNDGPLSVLKGFREHEMRSVLDTPGLREASIRRSWAFRLAVSIPGPASRQTGS